MFLPTCWWLGNNDAAATLKATFRIGQAIHSVPDVSFKMSFETVPQVNYIVHTPPNWNLSVSQFLNNTYFKIWFLFCDTCYHPILCHSTELFWRWLMSKGSLFERMLFPHCVHLHRLSFVLAYIVPMPTTVISLFLSSNTKTKENQNPANSYSS